MNYNRKMKVLWRKLTAKKILWKERIGYRDPRKITRKYIPLITYVVKLL